MMMRSSVAVNARIRRVQGFHELVSAPFADGVNALCWERELPGDFAEVARLLPVGEGITPLEEEDLLGLPVSEAGREAIRIMLEDLNRLRELGLEPELNCINGFLRDGTGGPVVTDVCSFHVDSATVEADTWLCTYFGATSEGLLNEEAVRKVDVPEIRAELLERYGGADDEGFLEHLSENCYDLHYAMLPGAQPYPFGVGNLWRIAVEHPSRTVPPCIHRAPESGPGERRLLLIS